MNKKHKYAHKEAHDTVRKFCVICGREYKFKTNFRRHYLKEHPTILREKRERGEKLFSTAQVSNFFYLQYTRYLPI